MPSLHRSARINQMSRCRPFSWTVGAALFLALAALFTTANAASADPDTSEHASCPPGQARDGNGVCVIQCPLGQALEQGACTPVRPTKPPPPPPQCPPGEILGVNGGCISDPPTQCPPGQMAINQGVCEPIKVCPPGQVLDLGGCKPVRPTQPPPCPPGEIRVLNGGCVPAPPTQCPPGQALEQGGCTPVRPTHPPQCPPGEIRGANGECEMPRLVTCPPGEVRTGDGRCEGLNALPRVGRPGEPLPREPLPRFEPPRNLPRPEPHERDLFRR